MFRLNVFIICIHFFVFSVFSLSWKTEFTTKELENIDLKLMFKSWAEYFNKTYVTIDEESQRYSIWLSNLYLISSTNDLNLGYKLRLNKFGDLTSLEFKSLYLTCLNTKDNNKIRGHKIIKPNDNNLEANPSSVDWTTQGVVTPVKDQGQCGGCWSFSATGAMECDYAIKYGKLTSLSEQQLLDCSNSYGNQGCNGGWYYNAWKYAAHDKGLCTEDAYPYI